MKHDLACDSVGLRSEVAICRAWIRLACRPTKGIRGNANSYALKHAVEAWSAKAWEHAYISNGAFIAAAVAEGYRGAPAFKGSPNACFALRVVGA